MLQIGKNWDGKYPFRFRRTVNQSGQAVVHDLGHRAEHTRSLRRRAGFQEFHKIVPVPTFRRRSGGEIGSVEAVGLGPLYAASPLMAPPLRRGFGDERARLDRVVHLEFDRVRGVFESVDFLPLQFHVGFDLVHVEDVALQQERMIGAQFA
jgi:hypothetical protein